MNEEIELKFRFEKKAALEAIVQHLCPAGVPPKVLEQSNTFFDTSDLRLRSKKIVIRLRQENDGYFLTLKGPSLAKTNDPTLAIHLEYEQPIDQNVALKMLKDKLNPLNYLEHQDERDPLQKKTKTHLIHRLREILGHRHVHAVGTFKNTRRLVPIQIDGMSLMLELDETHFGSDIVHYEAELELASTAHVETVNAYLNRLFSDLFLEPFSSRGKAERFFSFLVDRNSVTNDKSINRF